MPASPAIANRMYGSMLGISDDVRIRFFFKTSRGRLQFAKVCSMANNPLLEFHDPLVELAGDLPKRYRGDAALLVPMYDEVS